MPRGMRPLPEPKAPKGQKWKNLKRALKSAPRDIAIESAQAYKASPGYLAPVIGTRDLGRTIASAAHKVVGHKVDRGPEMKARGWLTESQRRKGMKEAAKGSPRWASAVRRRKK